MFKHSKKSITLALLLTIGTNSCSYGVNFGFLWGNNGDQPGIFQKAKNGLVRAKNYVEEKLTWAKDKIVEHATVGNVSLAISTGLIATLYATIYFYEKTGRLDKFYKKPSRAVKNCITKIARKLKIKNPEKIKILIDDKSHSDAASLFGTIDLCKKTASNIHSNESKYAIGHELSHYKHKDPFVATILRTSLFFLLAKWKNKMLRGGKEDIHLFRGLNHLSFGKRLLTRSFLLGGLVFIDIAGIFFYACPFILNHTFGKYCETRADIESASLGKRFANGGITFFKKTCLEWGKMSLPLRLFGSLSMPHFLPSIRVKYLKWYKKWKYGK